MSTDDELRAWRDAAVAGGLPQPHRERWQPLRAGVVNLWEFEAAEYWFADGWAQLMGRNETGKSSLMALTTLIPWLADTSSDKIDTLGRSGKQFSYYVKPTGADGDRRDASASFFHGWLWVEYGRVVDGEEDFFTTLLYASARSATGRVNLEWCTARGSRVRGELRLTQGREVQQPKAITAAGFTTHPSGLAYKAEVAGQLLNSPIDKLEIIGKILKVTRTPKLGAHLDVRFVTDHLRSSLPELRRSEIQQLAQGWDQLDQIRHDLQRTQEAADTVARFAGTQWKAWLEARLRLIADLASDRRTKFDNVRRAEEAARRTLESSEEAVAALELREQEARLTTEAATAAADQLRQSAAYSEAQGRLESARRADDLFAEARKRHGDVQRSLAQATRRVGDATVEDDTRRGGADAARKDAERAVDAVRAVAAEAGLTLSGDVDAERLRQRSLERRRDLGHAVQLLRKADGANADAIRLEEAAAALQSKATEYEASVEQTWAEAAEQHEALAEALSAWAAGLDPRPDTAAWRAALPTSVADLAGTPLSELVRVDWYEPHRLVLHEDRRAAEEGATQARRAATVLTGEITALETAGALPMPAPSLWRRRSRDGMPGAPFWRLVNPAGLDGADLARLEAALAAAGLLDAWVDPAGVSGLDTFVQDPDDAGEGARLSSVLRVDNDAGDLATATQRVLDGVALCAADEPLPTVGLAVAVDGRWRNSGLSGAAAPPGDDAQWLGEAARQAQRQRRLAELRKERSAREDEAAHYRAAADEATAAAQFLTDAFERSPSDRELRRTLDLAAERQRIAQAARAEAEAAHEKARAARSLADSQHAGFLRFVGDARLPTTSGGLDGVREALHSVERALDRLRTAQERHDSAQQIAEQAAARRAGAEREEAELVVAFEESHRTLGSAKRTAEELRAAIGADDAHVLERLEELRREAVDAARDRERLGAERLEQSVRLGQARERLQNLLAEREVATRERDAAFGEFRSLLDRGVVGELGLDLPEVDSSAVEHVRAQVAAVRRLVTPRRWEDGQGRAGVNEQELQRLRSALEARAREVNAELEQGGRALRLEPVDDLIRIDVTVNANGELKPLREAVTYLAATVATLQGAYDARVQETLDELLGSAFLEHMQERIGTAMALVRDINKVLGQHATTTSGTAMRIRLSPGQHRAVLDAVTGSALLDPEVQAQVREFLRDRVDEAKRQAVDEGQADWHDALARQLDYRDWYDIALERRIGVGGSWGPLTARSFAEMSGGARAVMLMLPLVATLAALYQDMPSAPRPIWLDEAFDGLDTANRSMVMDLLRQFDLDVLLAGPGRLVNVHAVPAAAIYQVVRAPAPTPGADLTLELWAGGSLEAIELPLSWLDLAEPGTDSGQESLL